MLEKGFLDLTWNLGGINEESSLSRGGLLNTKILLLIVAILLLLGISVLSQPVIVQEGNPLPVFIAILKLELNYTDVAPVSSTKYMQKAGSHEPFNKRLALQGWQFVEQMGAGLFYSRSGEQLFVMTRMLTTRYYIYELEQPLH